MMMACGTVGWRCQGTVATIRCWGCWWGWTKKLDMFYFLCHWFNSIGLKCWCSQLLCSKLAMCWWKYAASSEILVLEKFSVDEVTIKDDCLRWLILIDTNDVDPSCTVSILWCNFYTRPCLRTAKDVWNLNMIFAMRFKKIKIMGLQCCDNMISRWLQCVGMMDGRTACQSLCCVTQK